MSKDGWTCIYCFGKNNKEFLILAKFTKQTNQAPNRFDAAWKCNAGIKYKGGSGLTSAQGDLYLFEQGSKMDFNSPAFILEVFFRNDGTKNLSHVGSLPPRWNVTTNQGEHKWTIDDATAKRWRKNP